MNIRKQKGSQKPKREPKAKKGSQKPKAKKPKRESKRKSKESTDMGKSTYGDSRFPTGKATIIVGNAKALEALLAQIEGSATDKKPEYFVAGTSTAVTKLIEEKANKNQINAVLENYREMIAAQTGVPFVPTTISPAFTGIKTNQKDGKLSMTTVGARGNVPNPANPANPGIVL